MSEAGGLNWGSKFFSGMSGMVNPEKIVVDDPAFLLMTGANWSNSNPGNKAVWLGYETKEAAAQEQIKGLIDRPGFKRNCRRQEQARDGDLPSVLSEPIPFRRHSGAGEVAASRTRSRTSIRKATFDELHKQFLPIELTGVFWTELK